VIEDSEFNEKLVREMVPMVEVRRLSSTLFMVIAPAGTTLSTTATTIYSSGALQLVGGEVRIVLIVDPILVTEPVQVYIANGVN
jgi:hypothetical protein